MRFTENVPGRAYNFFLFEYILYSHSNYAVTIHYSIICFKSYLCKVARVRNAIDENIYVIFPNSVFFV
jgi:hypothetical protein